LDLRDTDLQLVLLLAQFPELLQLEGQHQPTLVALPPIKFTPLQAIQLLQLAMGVLLRQWQRAAAAVARPFTMLTVPLAAAAVAIIIKVLILWVQETFQLLLAAAAGTVVVVTATVPEAERQLLALMLLAAAAAGVAKAKVVVQRDQQQ
jgi:hypothetical protein